MSEGLRERWSSSNDWKAAARIAVALRIPEERESLVYRWDVCRRNARNSR
jgi:hypothetical protein